MKLKAVLLFLSLTAPFACAATYIVDPNGTGDYPTIQAAIDDANDGDIVELLPGIYTGGGNRDIEFLGKAITVRVATGDPNDIIIDCQGTESDPHRGFNFVSGEDTNSILENLTITNGYGPDENIDENVFSVGGGIYCNNSSPVIYGCIISYNTSNWGGGICNVKYSSPVINNCIIKNNLALSNGGGIRNYDHCSPSINNCTIKNNSANPQASGLGGGISNYLSSDPLLTNSTISNNSAGNGNGGGIYYYNSKPDIYNCTINYNSTTNKGGGIYGQFTNKATIHDCFLSNNSSGNGGGIFILHSSTASVTNCIFNSNVTDTSGAGIYIDDSSCTVRNCIFSNNSADTYGGGIYSESANTIRNCTFIYNSAAFGSAVSGNLFLTVNSCIIWANGSHPIRGEAVLSYCCIEGGRAGIGNIDENPEFIADYHLDQNSPCVDTGDPTYYGEPNEVDIDGERRVMGIVDMGADEVFITDSGALSVIPRSFDFQLQGKYLDIDDENFEIFNYGAYDLNWHIETPNDCNWLILEPLSGHTLSLEANEITLNIDQNNIDYGTYSCQLTVSDPNAQNSPQIVTVNLEVLGPEISVDKTNVYFTAYGKTDDDVANQQLMITNTGYDTLNWHIEIPNDCNWLSAIPQSGQVTDGNSIVTLSVDPNKAPDYGYNYCTMQIIDPNASNSPRSIVVRLRVFGPSMYISPSSSLYIFAEKNKEVNSNFFVGNIGYDTIDWNIEVPNDCNWLISVSPLSGSSGKFEFVEVAVAVDTNGLDEGFEDEIYLIINSPQISSEHYEVHLNVYEPNEIHVPYDYPTLQQAVDAAQFYGDTIIVHPGKYAGCDTKNKSLTITSTDPNNRDVVASTIIGSIIYNLYYNEYIKINGLSLIYDPQEIYYGQVHYPLFGVDSVCLNVSIENCTIKNWPLAGLSIGQYDGSGIVRAIIENCLITNNSSAGILIPIRSRFVSIDVNNCTITSTQEGVYGIKTDYAIDNIELNINNSILSNCKSSGDVEIAFDSTSSYVNVSNSCIPAGPNSIYVTSDSNITYGPGNIETDPCFVMTGYINDNNTPSDDSDDFLVEGDYHLKSQYGHWQQSPFVKMDTTGDGFLDMTDFAILAAEWSKTTQKQTMTERPFYDYYPYLRADLDNSGTVDINDLMLFCDGYLYYYEQGSWVYDDATSPCIDTGDPNSDWTAELWPHGKCINMGAYGGTAQASMSPETVGNPADFDNDDDVDINDLSLLSDVWPITKTLLKEDIDRNGFVDFFDFAIFANNWLWTETP